MMDRCYLEDCNQEGSIVVCYQPLYVRSCDEHYRELYKSFLKSRRPRNVNLGQTVDTYVKSDGSIGKITAGKAWEIENRTISPDDGRSVVNKKTGKPPEY